LGTPVLPGKKTERIFEQQIPAPMFFRFFVFGRILIFPLMGFVGYYFSFVGKKGNINCVENVFCEKKVMESRLLSFVRETY